MPYPTPRRLAGAAAVPTLALALVACGAESGDTSGDPPGELSPEQVVLASYDELEGESYQMRSELTVDGVDFMEMVQEVEGESLRATQDMYMSAMLELMVDEIPQDDPKAAEAMEAMFSDMHTEMVVVDDVAYLQFSGGVFDSLAEEFGADAWFSAEFAEFAELTGSGDLAGVYEQLGSLDLAAQTELLLTELTDVRETGDGVYTGTLAPDSEVMRQLMGTAAVGGDPAMAEVMEAAEVAIALDGDGVMQQMEISFPEIEGMAMTMISEVVEIGGDYDIAVPDSDNMHSFEEFINSGMR